MDRATALVEYHVAAETTFAFVRHGRSFEVVDLRLSGAHLAQQVQRLRQVLPLQVRRSQQLQRLLSLPDHWGQCP